MAARRLRVANKRSHDPVGRFCPSTGTKPPAPNRRSPRQPNGLRQFAHRVLSKKTFFTPRTKVTKPQRGTRAPWRAANRAHRLREHYRRRRVSNNAAGDFNANNSVDGADFLMIQRGLGVTHTSADFTTFNNNFGTVYAVAAASAVPEPAPFALATSALGAMLGRRARGKGLDR